MWKSSGTGALDHEIKATELQIQALELDDLDNSSGGLDDSDLRLLYNKFNALVKTLLGGLKGLSLSGPKIRI